MADTFYVARPLPGQRTYLAFSPAEWMRLAGLYGFIARAARRRLGALPALRGRAIPALIGLGFVAYMFGLRHAFDADHIAAIDDTVRYLLQKGKKPLGIGFFFSLGHSTIVLCLAVGIAFAAAAVKQDLPEWKNIGGIIGASVSGMFLWIIGVLNLLVLLDILGVWKKAKAGTHDHRTSRNCCAKRGLVNRLFGGRLQKVAEP